MVVQGDESIDDGHQVPDRPRPTIVAIGASAGGIKALQTFFDVLPERVGAAIVVVIHLDPEHESELSQVLAAHTRMPVTQVREAVTLGAWSLCPVGLSSFRVGGSRRRSASNQTTRTR